MNVATPRRRLALAVACLLVGGCAALAPPADAPPIPVVEEPSPPPPTPPMVPREPAPPVVSEPPPVSMAALPPLLPPVNEEDIQALTLLTDLHKLASAGEEARRDVAGLNQAVTRPRSDAAKVKLALLLTMPSVGATDEARAIALLEQVMGKSPGSTPTRQVAALLHAILTEHQRSMREEQKKSEGLQQKLDALKSVERSLLGRDRRSTTPSARTPFTNSK